MQPDHCYMGFWADEQHTVFLALETTLLGVTAETPDEVPEELEDAIDEELRRDKSWPSFVHAILGGTSKFINDGEKFKTEPDYQMIDIALARQAGFLPIPYHSAEEFVAFDFSDYLGANGVHDLSGSDASHELALETEMEDSDEDEADDEEDDDDQIAGVENE
jgi:hypothetical protein